MKYPVLALFALFPFQLLAQDEPTPERLPGFEPRSFACSMIDQIEVFDGSWQNLHKAEDGRPKVIHIPSLEPIHWEEISDDGRFYRYSRLNLDENGAVKSTLLGIFDLRNETLKTIWSGFGIGNDNLARVYGYNVEWVCTDMEQMK